MEYYKYVIGILIGIGISGLLLGTNTGGKEFHATTQVQTKTKTVYKEKSSQRCKATVVYRPDGRVVVSTTAKTENKASSKVNTSNNAKATLSNIPSSRYGIGVSVYISSTYDRWPSEISSKMVTIQVTKDITDSLSVGVFYKLDGTIGLGIGIKF